MKVRHLVLALVGAAALVPAAASAQPAEFGYGPPAYGRQDYRPYGYGDPLRGRIERVRQWMRHGSDEGWLDGRRARRAWNELRVASEESRGDDYARRDAWRRLDNLTNYLRWAQRNAEG